MFLLMAVMITVTTFALPAISEIAGLSYPAAMTVQAASKKVVKKANGYYSAQGKTGYWANKSYKTNGLKRIYKFNSAHYMSKSSYNKMVKALKKKSYKALKKAIGKGKLLQKGSSCNGGKYDYVYKYGSIKVYTTDNTITYIE